MLAAQLQAGMEQTLQGPYTSLSIYLHLNLSRHTGASGYCRNGGIGLSDGVAVHPVVEKSLDDARGNSQA